MAIRVWLHYVLIVSMLSASGIAAFHSIEHVEGSAYSSHADKPLPSFQTRFGHHDHAAHSHTTHSDTNSSTAHIDSLCEACLILSALSNAATNQHFQLFKNSVLNTPGFFTESRLFRFSKTYSSRAPPIHA